MASKNRKVRLEDIAREKISSTVLCAIDDLDIEPGFYFSIGKRTSEFKLVIKIPTRKLLAWLGGLVATTGGTVAVLQWLIPILIEYFSKPPP